MQLYKVTSKYHIKIRHLKSNVKNLSQQHVCRNDSFILASSFEHNQSHTVP